MEGNKTYYIESLGCAKNQVDSEILIASLSLFGWKRLDEPTVAEFIIVNTCGFIEPAIKESIDVLISFRDAFPDAKIVATGCLSQRYPKEIAASMPNIDAVFGNRNISILSEHIDQMYSSTSEKQIIKIIDTKEISKEKKLKDNLVSSERQDLLSVQGSAYVKITEGCNNNCSFCAIPLIRGKLQSRNIENIIIEIKNLTERGIKEINLIGQDLGSYGRDIKNGKSLLAELLAKTETISGDFKIRMLYIHPDNFPFDILPICQSSKHIIPYFDIPFQHASKKILLKMNRRGNAEKYLALIGLIRESLPDAIIRSTFMLGFPGETLGDLKELESFILKAEIDWAGFFIYSKEEGTPAFHYGNRLSHRLRVKKAEKILPEFQALQTEITEKRLKRYSGQTFMLLVEEAIEKEDLFLCRGIMQAPEVDGLVVLHAEEKSLSPGDCVKAEIIGVNGIDLEARLKA